MIHLQVQKDCINNDMETRGVEKGLTWDHCHSKSLNVMTSLKTTLLRVTSCVEAP